MKKSVWLSTALCVLLLSGCGGPGANTEPTDAVQGGTPEPTKEVIYMYTEKDADYVTEQWRAVQIDLTSTVAYKTPFYDAEITAVFTAPDGSELTMPGFWNGKDSWAVRFAPTMPGIWNFLITCTDEANQGLTKSGTLACSTYQGNLAIYQHGFLRVSDNGRYFTYADGTPFFYLGDTHWFLSHERLNTSNVEGVASEFRYIIDKRVSQNFTVIQSEPIQRDQQGAHNGDSETEEPYYELSRLTQSDIPGFQQLDTKYKYIADSGLVHSNATLNFRDSFKKSSVYTPEYLRRLTRYWVARYAAYPVLWSTAQEIDPDVPDGQAVMMDTTNDLGQSVWTTVAEAIYEFDPYHHPLSAHTQTGIDLTDESNFKDKPYHTWFAYQWAYERYQKMDLTLFRKNYINATKPIILYESRYDGYWETDFPTTANQAYTAWLLGMYGHGYGVDGIWNDLYSAMDIGSHTYHVGDHTWYTGANSEGGTIMSYVARFYSGFDWWKLTPSFNDKNVIMYKYGAYGVHASIEDKTHIIYFYGKTEDTGSLKSLSAGQRYTFRWYDPFRGEYTAAEPDTVSDSGILKLPDRPDDSNWILVAEKA